MTTAMLVEVDVMNRAKKASEPSMEDILASIRRIISDEDRANSGDDSSQSFVPEQSSSVGGAVPSPASKPPKISAYSAVSNARLPSASDETPPDTYPFSEEDVLDLTEELILSDQQSPNATEPQAVTSTVVNSPSSASESAPSEAFVTPPHTLTTHTPIEPVAPLVRRQLPPSQTESRSFSKNSSSFSRPSGFDHAANVVQPPVVSRHFSQSVKKNDQSKTASPEAPSQKDAITALSEGVQMPVPEQGPVPLVETPPEPRTWSQRTFHTPPVRSNQDKASASIRSRSSSNLSGSADPFNQAYASPSRNVPKIPPNTPVTPSEAVTKTAETLAKSAIDSLDDQELQNAGHIDFAHLDETQKNIVSESFASAIEASQEGSAVPASPQSLLEDVLRHDFPSELRSQDIPEMQHAWPTASGAEETAATSRDRIPAPSFLETSENAPSTLPISANSTKIDQPTGNVAAEQSSSKDVIPVAQAQFIDSREPSTSLATTTPRSLEDSVRDMLRPLLVQWLNDNMPRIIENAIREEIAQRGLVPPRDSKN